MIYYFNIINDSYYEVWYINFRKWTDNLKDQNIPE